MGFFRKKQRDDAEERSCLFCEFATVSDGEKIFCKKKKKEKLPEDCCSFFVYDLLKRTVKRTPPFPSVDFFENEENI